MDIVTAHYRYRSSPSRVLLEVQPDLTGILHAEVLIPPNHSWELQRFWVENGCSRSFQKSSVERIVLEELIATKDRRKGAPGLTPEGSDDSLTLKELIIKVVTKGHQEHGWGVHQTLESCVDFYLNRHRGMILEVLPRIQAKFGCLIFSHLDGWRQLETRLSLTKQVELRVFRCDDSR